jgi:hypothetical protein
MALTTFLVSVACGAVFAQQIGLAESAQAIAPYEEVDAADAPDIVFTNLGPSRDNLYTLGGIVILAGQRAVTRTENWAAVRFTPKVDVQAKVLSAAVQWESGDKLIKLGLYDNNDILQTVGRCCRGAKGARPISPTSARAAS